MTLNYHIQSYDNEGFWQLKLTWSSWIVSLEKTRHCWFSWTTKTHRPPLKLEWCYKHIWQQYVLYSHALLPLLKLQRGTEQIYTDWNTEVWLFTQDSRPLRQMKVVCVSEEVFHYQKSNLKEVMTLPLVKKWTLMYRFCLISTVMWQCGGVIKRFFALK